MIVSFGTVSLDWIQTEAVDRTNQLGGSALYFAAAASRYAKVRVLGAIGPDYPMARLEPLVRQGVDLGGLRAGREKSFRWAAKYSPDGEARETTSTNRQVLESFRPVLNEAERTAHGFFIGSTDPSRQADALSQLPGKGEEGRGFVALDSMTHWIRRETEAVRSLTKNVELFLGNDEEAEALTGHANTLDAAREILALGPTMAIVKHGKRGATCVTHHHVITQPAEKVDTVDPTGAGDAFAGGFIGFWLATGDPLDTSYRGRLEEAMRAGTLCGALATVETSFDGLLINRGL